MSSCEIELKTDENEPRLLCYCKDGKVNIWLNASEKDIALSPAGSVLYSNLYDEAAGILKNDGILVTRS